MMVSYAEEARFKTVIGGWELQAFTEHCLGPEIGESLSHSYCLLALCVSSEDSSVPPCAFPQGKGDSAGSASQATRLLFAGSQAAVGIYIMDGRKTGIHHFGCWRNISWFLRFILFLIWVLYSRSLLGLKGSLLIFFYDISAWEHVPWF